MSTELTYNQFRAELKGTPQKEISALWKAYKADAQSNSLSVEEEFLAKNKIADIVMEDNPELLTEEVEEVVETKLSLQEACVEFDRIRVRMERFPFKYSKATIKAGKARMAELAKQTIPVKYSCTPTDSWKIWFGPTKICLLINTTNKMGFRVTRDWWQKNYQTTVYVDRELLNNNDVIVQQANQLTHEGRYLARTPLVGVECKLPQSVKDIQIRGGQSGDN